MTQDEHRAAFAAAINKGWINGGLPEVLNEVMKVQAAQQPSVTKAQQWLKKQEA